MEKILNNSENKARFFAQYFGQDVWALPTSKYTYYLDGTILNTIDKGGHSDSCLTLRLLSSVTDEEAVEIPIHGNFASARHWLACMEGYGRNFYDIFIGRHVEIYQYLQSRSFALPYHNLSVDQLIEFGWIRIESKN